MVWQVAAGFAVAGGLYSASQKRKAAREAQRQAKLQAAEFRRQKFDVALLASQQHEQRSEKFKELAAYNDAMSAYMGRTGRSIQALRREEERRYGRDVDRLRAQEKREKDRLEKQAELTIAKGRVASDVYRQQARATLFDTAYKVASIV